MEIYPIGSSLLAIKKSSSNNSCGWKDVRSVVSPTFTTGKLRLVSITDTELFKANIIDV